MTSSLKGEGFGQKMTCNDMMTRGNGLMTKYPLFVEILGKSPIILIHLRGHIKPKHRKSI